jgi:transposase
MSMVRLPLPIVSPALLVAASTPALLVPLATELDRFASPPWDRSSPEWQRLDRKLSSDHLARRIDGAVGLLDLSALLGSYRGRGSLPCRPDLLLKVVLFEVQRGRPSPAQWLENLHETESCQWLAFGLRPSRSRLYAFRDRLADYLDDWHQQLIGPAMSQGLTTASEGSLDGTLIAANATRHRTLNEDLVNKRLALLAQALTADKANQPLAQEPGWMATTPRDANTSSNAISSSRNSCRGVCRKTASAPKRR